MTTEISDLRAHLALTVVGDAIERKRPGLKDDDQFPYRTRDVRRILFDNLKCLKSILKVHRLQEGSYHIAKKNIREVLQAIGYYTPNNACERDIERMIGGLTQLVEDVYSFEKNPENFYESERAPVLLHFCECMLDKIYPEKCNIFTDRLHPDMMYP